MIKGSAQDILAIAQSLIAVKKGLRHGCFTAWLGAEFLWDGRTAQPINVAADGTKSDKLSELNLALAIYILAVPSTLEVAKREAIARTEADEFITHKVITDINQKYSLSLIRGKLKPIKSQPEVKPSELEVELQRRLEKPELDTQLTSQATSASALR